MFINEFTEKTRHVRRSKLGVEHEYYRNKTFVNLKCDNCNASFVRPRGSMDPKRLNNNYFHVCKDCDAKIFAQKRGVERRKVWSLTASSTIPISKL
jgi:hypothetical protein